MKKLLIPITIFLTCFKGHSQTYLIPSIGISNNLYFVAGIGFNEQIAGRIQLTAQMIDMVNVRAGANFGGNIGLIVLKTDNFKITPAIGYYYHYFSSDKTEYTKGTNYWSMGYFVKGELDKWFIEAGLIRDEFNLRIGLKIQL